ncbi:hypothetical protein QBC43DRAFT_294533 [Cladorrhinum sp. PSN259]|nr:hypothetical protein QBC43DRAFT_294533 [Cladorrhinum sp. PSN259]
MFLMYARLYFILFRAHRRLVSLDASGSRQLDSNSLSAAAVSARHARRLKRLARLMLLYPLTYAIIWSLPTCIRIYQTITGNPVPWQLQTLDKACIVLAGLRRRRHIWSDRELAVQLAESLVSSEISCCD